MDIRPVTENVYGTTFYHRVKMKTAGSESTTIFTGDMNWLRDKLAEFENDGKIIVKVEIGNYENQWALTVDNGGRRLGC